MVRLSKSKVMSALQCPKRLHLEVHRPELAQHSPKTEAIFATGHAVGALARELLGAEDGVFIDREWGMGAALDKTAELMSQGVSAIYEAASLHDGVLVYIDVLRREAEAWRIIEVKSSTSVKDEHLRDCAVQAWVFQGAGHSFSGVSVAHVDTSFAYPGGGDYRGLLTEVDATEDATALLGSVPGWVAKAHEATASEDLDTQVGEHCSKPHDCPFDDHCWPNHTTYPVRRLGGRKKKLASFANNGYADIREVPLIELTSAKHKWIHRVTKAGEPDLREDAIRFARGLEYPRYYLDFETIGPAIPVWPGTRPYRALPFQWSCHIEDAPGSLRHTEFLEISPEPTMRNLAEAMLDTLGQAGPILMYSSYEKTVIKNLTKLFPDLAPSLQALIERLVDLKKIAENNYYHPAMLGSWSIKAVLPTVAPDIDYGQLEEIQNGTAASNAYIEAIDPATDEVRREFLRERMLEYCRLDSEAMVRVLHFFASGGETAPIEVAS